MREDKRGLIDESLSPILDRLDIEPEYWMIMATKFDRQFAPGTACIHYIYVNKARLKSLVGAAHELRRAANAMGYRRAPGLQNASLHFALRDAMAGVQS